MQLRYNRKRLIVGVCVAIAIFVLSFYSQVVETYQVFNNELTVFNEREGQVLSKNLIIPKPWMAGELLINATLRIQLESVADFVDRPVRIYFNNILIEVKIAKTTILNRYEIDITDLLRKYAGQQCEIYVMIVMKQKGEWVSKGMNLWWRGTADIYVKYFTPYNLPIQAAALAVFIGVSWYGRQINLQNVVKSFFIWFVALTALLGFMLIIVASLFNIYTLLERGGCLIFLSALLSYLLYTPTRNLEHIREVTSKFILTPLYRTLAFLYKHTTFLHHDCTIILLGGLICLIGLLLGTPFKEIFVVGAGLVLGGCMWLIIKMFSLEKAVE
jgi:hypothetical protein